MFVELPLAPITRSKRSFAGLISQLQSPAIFADPAFLNVLCDARTTTVRRVSVGGARYYKIGNLRWKYLIALALSSRCTVWKPHQKHPKAVSQISLFFLAAIQHEQTQSGETPCSHCLMRWRRFPKKVKHAWLGLSLWRKYMQVQERMGSQIRILNISEPYIPTADVPSVNNGWVLRFHLGMCKDWASMGIHGYPEHWTLHDTTKVKMHQICRVPRPSCLTPTYCCTSSDIFSRWIHL